MEWELILNLVRPELIIIIVCCYILGLFLKATSRIEDKLIPIVILLFGIIFTILYIAIVLGEGLTGKVFIVGILQGLICTAIAVYGNQVFKQISSK